MDDYYYTQTWCSKDQNLPYGGGVYYKITIFYKGELIDEFNLDKIDEDYINSIIKSHKRDRLISIIHQHK
jgi:hypothetical protein